MLFIEFYTSMTFSMILEYYINLELMTFFHDFGILHKFRINDIMQIFVKQKDTPTKSHF